MDQSESTVTKPTFSAVHNSQESLRIFLEKLIAKNRPLTLGERELYYNLLASSTLGLGVHRKFRIYIDNKIFHYGTIESTGRWLGRQTDSSISIPSDYGNLGSSKIDIKFFWDKLLEELFYIYPLALDRALSMSREDTDMPAKHIRGAKVGRRVVKDDSV